MDGVMNTETAEEYTQALAQVWAGGYRQVLLGQKLGVPALLGLSTEAWVNERLGGYVQLSLQERQEAVKELIKPVDQGGEGLSTRAAAAVLGVSQSTVVRDAPTPEPFGSAEPEVQSKKAKSHADGHAERNAAAEAKVGGRARTEKARDIYGRIEYGTGALAYLMGLREASVDLCITSPPYWAKRTYIPGEPLELGQESTPELYVDSLCEIVNEIGRVLTKEDKDGPGGCLFLNIGDTLASQPGQYRGDPERQRGISTQAIRANGTATADRQLDVVEKSYCMIPERIIMRLVLQDGWRLAGKIIWHKVGHQPENVFDRLTQAWEPIYVLTRAKHVFFKRGSDRADVWAIPVGRGGGAAGHLAPFPEALVERAIKHACPEGGTVLDPFAGSGTVLDVARRMSRYFVGCDLAPSGDAA